MRDKLARYRRLAESLAELGDEQAKAITTDRYKLMYHYFVRCAGLTAAIILLVETGYLAAAYALEKSLVDALLNGLYLGYVASDKEVNSNIASAINGRCTAHSGMKKRAKMLDENFKQRRTFMNGMFGKLVKHTSEYLNEFGHGGLLSTALDVKPFPPKLGYKVVADSVFVLIIFLGNVFVLENLDLTRLTALQQEFAGEHGGLTAIEL